MGNMGNMGNMACVLFSRILSVCSRLPVLADLMAPPVGGFPEGFKYVSPEDLLEEIKLKVTVFLCVFAVVLVVLILGIRAIRKNRRKKEAEHEDLPQEETGPTEEN